MPERRQAAFTIFGAVIDRITKRNLEVLQKLEKLAAAERTGADRVAGHIANFCGSMKFVWIHAGLFGLWIFWNLFPGLTHFDKFPFILLTLTVSLESIFLSSFIMISQNYDMRLTERRDKLELQLALLSEEEATKILLILGRITSKLGLKNDDFDVKELEKETQPESLIALLEKLTKKP